MAPQRFDAKEVNCPFSKHSVRRSVEEIGITVENFASGAVHLKGATPISTARFFGLPCLFFPHSLTCGCYPEGCNDSRNIIWHFTLPQLFEG